MSVLIVHALVLNKYKIYLNKSSMQYILQTSIIFKFSLALDIVYSVCNLYITLFL
jgi:hypothetical protein